MSAIRACILWNMTIPFHRKLNCAALIRFSQTDFLIQMNVLYILLHLMGDLHMPLHTGYDDDLGGNNRVTCSLSRWDHEKKQAIDTPASMPTAIQSGHRRSRRRCGRAGVGRRRRAHR